MNLGWRWLFGKETVFRIRLGMLAALGVIFLAIIWLDGPSAKGTHLTVVVQNDGPIALTGMQILAPTSHADVPTVAPGARQTVNVSDSDYGDVGLAVRQIGLRAVLLDRAPGHDGVSGTVVLDWSPHSREASGPLVLGTASTRFLRFSPAQGPFLLSGETHEVSAK